MLLVRSAFPRRAWERDKGEKMGFVIKYFYKDCLVLVTALPVDVKRLGWAKHCPPYQPENWDRWEVAPAGCERSE